MIAAARTEPLPAHRKINFFAVQMQETGWNVCRVTKKSGFLPRRGRMGSDFGAGDKSAAVTMTANRHEPVAPYFATVVAGKAISSSRF